MKNRLLISAVFAVTSLQFMRGGVALNQFLVFLGFLTVYTCFSEIFKKKKTKADGFFLYPDFYRALPYHFLMLGGLLLLLCFLEISSQRSFSSDGLKIQIFGLSFLILSFTGFKFIPKKYFGFSFILVLVFAAAIISSSNLVSMMTTNYLIALPLVALSVFVITVSWSYSYQFLTLLLFLIQYLFLNDNIQGVYFFTVSAVGLILIACFFERPTSMRYGRGLFKDKDERHVQGNRTRKFKRMFFQFALQEEPSKKERLIVGVLIAGLISCIVSSRILYDISPSNNWPVVFTWLAFFALWASAVYFEKREKRVEIFWSYSALISMLILLWPCSLFFGLKNIGYFWLFWPSCIFFAIGMVPWRPRELLILLIVFSVVGAQIISAHTLGLPGISIFLISAITSVLLSLRTSRSIREREYLLQFPKFLQKCETSSDVIKLLALHMMGLFNVPFSMYRADEGPASVLLGSNIFDEIQGLWPAKIYTKEVDEFSDSDSSVEMYTSKEKLELEVTNRGFLKAQSFFGLTLHSIEKVEYVFPLNIPLIPYFRSSELLIAKSLAQIASSKISEIISESMLKKIQKDFEHSEDAREFELSSLVHDINNTVQDLTILCDTLIEDDDLTEKDKKANKISAIARSVATVVSDAKCRREIDNHGMGHSTTEVDLVYILKELIEYAVVRAEQRGISFISNVQSGEEIFIKVPSREHLETTLRNILNNAIAYSDSDTCIEVSVEKNDSLVRINIKDEGAGLSVEEQQAVFEAGFRADSAVRRASGLGIGLAQAKAVVEAAGGSINVFSAGKSKGSTFILSFPLLKKETKNFSPWALVLDDQFSVLELYSKVLKDFSLPVSKATSVLQAMDFVKKNGPPTFVISDVNLGSENGLDLVRNIRSLHGFHIPILVISGMPFEEVSSEARAAGASDFISKPIRSTSLKARIETLLSEYKEYKDFE